MKNLGLLIVFLFATTLASGCEQAKPSNALAGGDATTANSANETVQLEIDFGGRLENKSFEIACSADATVFSILEQAEKNDLIKLESRGSKKNSFLISLDDIENEGSSGDNWIYRVNGEVGKVGAGEQTVNPGDVVNWTLGEYQPNEQ